MFSNKQLKVLLDAVNRYIIYVKSKEPGWENNAEYQTLRDIKERILTIIQ